MNIQFSLSATSGSNTTGIDNQQRITAIEGTNLISAKEAYGKEKSGVPLSMGEEQLIRTINRAVKALEGPQTILDFSVHEKTRDIMVKVLNKETGEVIREIPREKTLDLVARMMEIAGILVDEKI